MSVHFTETERMLLAQLISEEKAIENKRTGAADLKDKAEAWERVTKKYCSQGFTPRTSKQLKKCWDNMKQKYVNNFLNILNCMNNLHLTFLYAICFI